MYSCTWTVTGSVTQLKTGSGRVKQHKLFLPFLTHCYQFSATLPIMHINGGQFPVFFTVNLEIIVCNVTSHNKQRCAIAKFELKSFALCQFRICNFRQKQHINGLNPVKQNLVQKFSGVTEGSHFWCWVIF